MASACFRSLHNKYTLPLLLSLEHKEILPLVSRATKFQGLRRTDRGKLRQGSSEVIEPKMRCLNFPTHARTRMINAARWLCPRCNYCWSFDHYLVTLLCSFGPCYLITAIDSNQLLLRKFFENFWPKNRQIVGTPHRRTWRKIVFTLFLSRWSKPTQNTF